MQAQATTTCRGPSRSASAPLMGMNARFSTEEAVNTKGIIVLLACSSRSANTATNADRRQSTERSRMKPATSGSSDGRQRPPSARRARDGSGRRSAASRVKAALAAQQPLTSHSARRGPRAVRNGATIAGPSANPTEKQARSVLNIRRLRSPVIRRRPTLSSCEVGTPAKAKNSGANGQQRPDAAHPGGGGETDRHPRGHGGNEQEPPGEAVRAATEVQLDHDGGGGGQTHQQAQRAVDPPSSRVTNSGTATVRMAPAAPQKPRASASWGQRE